MSKTEANDILDPVEAPAVTVDAPPKKQRGRPKKEAGAASLTQQQLRMARAGALLAEVASDLGWTSTTAQGRSGETAMTESEWLSSTDPARMLDYLKGTKSASPGSFRPCKISGRKLRLFACACCRAIGQQEQADRLEVIAKPYGGLSWFEVAQNWINGTTLSGSEQAALLRDIVGSPFRPVKVRAGSYRSGTEFLWSEDWLTSTVLSVAQAIYDERAFDRMPVLGDALEQAGCDNQEVLEHCRNLDSWKVCPSCEEKAPDWETNVVECNRCDCTGLIPDEDTEPVHVRGCWVLDTMLGKD